MGCPRAAEGSEQPLHIRRCLAPGAEHKSTNRVVGAENRLNWPDRARCSATELLVDVAGLACVLGRERPLFLNLKMSYNKSKVKAFQLILLESPSRIVPLSTFITFPKGTLL